MSNAYGSTCHVIENALPPIEHQLHDADHDPREPGERDARGHPPERRHLVTETVAAPGKARGC